MSNPQAPQTPPRPIPSVGSNGKKKLTPIYERTLKDMRDQRAILKERAQLRRIMRGRKLTFTGP